MPLLDNTLSEHFEYQLEILPITYVIQVRRADVVMRGEKEIARSYHRHVVSPGDDISKEPAEVQTVANALWTPEIIEAYKANQQVEEKDSVSTADAEEDSVSTADAEEDSVSTADIEE